MADKYFFSTLSTDMSYDVHHRPNAAKPEHGDQNYTTVKSVLIHGGANVADGHFLTARGKMTRVSEAAYNAIKDNPVLKIHVENGFVVIEDAPAEVDSVVKNMKAADTSAPMTPESVADDQDAPQLYEGETKRGRGRPAKV